MIGIGVGAVVLIVLVVVLIMTLSEGGKFAGDSRPGLPDEFDGWVAGEDNFGMVEYTKDGSSVMIMEAGPIPEADRPEPGEMPTIEGFELPEDFEQSSPASGITCGASAQQSAASCTILYEDYTMFLLNGSDLGTVEDAALALADAA